MSRNSWIVLSIGGLLIALVLSCACLAASMMVLSQLASQNRESNLAPYESDGDAGVASIAEMFPATPQESQNATGTLETLANAQIPESDLFDLAFRLRGLPEASPTGIPFSPFNKGNQHSFWALDTDINQSYQIQATLQHITPHSYFWVEDGVDFDRTALEKLAETFEKQIYPTTRQFFGSEWVPGVDSDPHLHILYARYLGESIAGYFSSPDEYPPSITPYSNTKEIFFLSAEHVNLDDPFAYGVLAHEFQHMIQWRNDRNEELWMNEGFSDLASFINGYPVGGADRLYVRNPDIQLNNWPIDSNNRSAQYGSSFLYMVYFLDRMGSSATRSLVRHAANGLESVDQILKGIGAVDSITGQPVEADDLFLDWVITSYLQDESVADGRYTYHIYPDAPAPSATEEVNDCPINPQYRTVRQYGVDYIEIKCRGSFNLSFEGTSQVPLLPADAHSGEYAFWSNRGDEANMTLTRPFDFRQVSGPLTLSYWAWYDLEPDYDYLHLAASLDGERWQLLTTPSGTLENPSGASFGWSYNGASGGDEFPVWIKQRVDLSQFAGQQIWLRFEYVTDGGVNGDGFLVDDLSIPQIGYATDFESDDGGWLAQGFVRIQNSLPQTFRVALIQPGKDATTIQKYSLHGENSLEIPLQLSRSEERAILVVSGTTRYTRQKATYRFSLEP